MKIQKAVFTFRGWKFTWTVRGATLVDDRAKTIWYVYVQRTNAEVPKSKRQFVWEVVQFTPSAAACRRIKKKILNKPVWKRKNITYTQYVF